MNNSIEISADTASKVIECLESRISACDADLKAIDEGRAIALQRRAEFVETLARLRNSLAAIETKGSRDGKERERRPKNYGLQLIRQVLEAQPYGAGLTIAEIEQKTGVNHATVFRTLKTPKRNKGLFVTDDGKRWRLSVKILGTEAAGANPVKQQVASH
jgi:Fic family protein